MQYEINNSDWTQISTPGRNITVRLDEQDDGAVGHCDLRVMSSILKPAINETTLTQAKVVYKPGGNNDSLFLSPGDTKASFWARTANPEDIVNMIVDYDGIGQPVRIDVVPQDNVSDNFDVFFTRKLASVTLAAPVAKDARNIQLVAGHGFTIGTISEMIEIDNGTGGFYQSRVIGVVGNTIEVANPAHTSFPITSTAQRTSPDMNIDASAAPVYFTVKPPVGVKWHVYMMSVNITDATAMDDTLFGGMPAPSRGAHYRTVNSHCIPIFTAIDNSCFRRHCDSFEYSPNAGPGPTGGFGMGAKRYFTKGEGVVREIGGSEISQMECILYNDYRALVRYWSVIRGHKVVD